MADSNSNSNLFGLKDDSGNKMEQQPDTKLVEETVAVAMSETTFRFFVLNATKTTVRSNP
ncbi:unnamed protein product [Ilex paraguariensis]|uniref:Uncharacterized protein n=1 Tax=Ilex paraguariensis TaxID=185542 RepID=A0ABC8UNK7_9AQUA